MPYNVPITHISTFSFGAHPVLSSISLASSRTIKADEFKDYMIYEITTGHASNTLILPVLKGALVYIINKDGVNPALVKRNGQTTPVTVGAGKSAILYCDGTDYRRLTPDA